MNGHAGWNQTVGLPLALAGGTRAIGNVQIHAWHGCNLYCESCAHYSQLGMRGGPSAEDCAEWMRPWAKRIFPHEVMIVGGEPTLNHELVEIIRVALEIWPRSQIRMFTNGFLLKRFPELPKLMVESDGRVWVDISRHHTGPEYDHHFAKVRKLMIEWRQQYPTIKDKRIILNKSYERWTRRYHVEGNQIKLFDSNPHDAWKVCIGKGCRQIYLGKLWKCPEIAYYPLMRQTMHADGKYDRLHAMYEPLDPDCSDQELVAFLTRREEGICRMCPSKLEKFALPDPLEARKGQHF